MALSGIQNGVRLHAVTLGSPTTQNRWDDLEIIFEWGWKFAALAREKGLLLPLGPPQTSVPPAGANPRQRRASKPDLSVPCKVPAKVKEDSEMQQGGPVLAEAHVMPQKPEPSGVVYAKVTCFETIVYRCIADVSRDSLAGGTKCTRGPSPAANYRRGPLKWPLPRH